MRAFVASGVIGGIAIAAMASLGCGSQIPEAMQPGTEPAPGAPETVPTDKAAPPEQAPAGEAQPPSSALPQQAPGFGYLQQQPQVAVDPWGQETGKPPVLQVRELQDQVNQLAGATGDPRHPEAVQALWSLAAALRALPGANDRARMGALAVEQQAIRIERSGPQSLAHGDAVKRALGEALSAVESLDDTYAGAGLEAQVERARNAVDAIDQGKPFLDQRGAIVGAFQQVTRALALVGR